MKQIEKDKHYLDLVDALTHTYEKHVKNRYESEDILLLEAKTAITNLMHERDGAVDSLNAWFDDRKHTRETVDKAIMETVASYLRTSRNGGMPSKQSDMIYKVVEHMTELGLFGDIFTMIERNEKNKGV